MITAALRSLGICMSLTAASINCKAGSEYIATFGFFRSSRTGLLSTRKCSKGTYKCHSGSSAGRMSVDITRHNIKEALPAVREALGKCSFFALDCEMTGLFTDGNKHEYLDDIQARYSKMSESSKSYIITQYGLSCFEATGPNSYAAHTFNFYLFPQPHGAYNRRFLCDASSLVFLAEHGFDFNKCISQGVPYMPVRTRDFQLLQVARSSEPRGAEPITNATDKDKVFIADLVQLVTDWLAGNMPSSSNMLPDGVAHAERAANGAMADADQWNTSDEVDPTAAANAAVGQQQHAVLALPAFNSYQRLLAYRELAKPQFGVEGHAGFWVKKLPDSRYLVLVRATQQQAEQLEAEAKAERIAAIHDAAGFAAVFDLMRRSGKPAVGHNCMFDVAYGLYSFADAYLPATWRDYKKMVNAWHPGGVYDTKYIARRLPEVFDRDTSLATVYTLLMHNEYAEGIPELLEAATAAAGTPVQLPSICHAPGFDKYRSLAPGEAAHEAGYDAFMTGAAFARLLPLVAGKIAADPLSELAAAYEAAQTAAADDSIQLASSPLPPPSPLTQQQQQLHPQQQQQSGGQKEGGCPNANPLHYVQGLAGRLNLTYTDLAYAALRGSDPVPERPYTFHLSGLQPGYRADEVWKMLQRVGLGSVRITQLDSTSCLAEFQSEVAPLVAETLASAVMGVVAIPWAEYATMRYSQRVPDLLEPAAGTADRGLKRTRLDEPSMPQQGSKQAVVPNSHRPGGQGVLYAESESGSEDVDDQPATQSRCSIM